MKIMRPLGTFVQIPWKVIDYITWTRPSSKVRVYLWLYINSIQQGIDKTGYTSIRRMAEILNFQPSTVEKNITILKKEGAIEVYESSRKYGTRYSVFLPVYSKVEAKWIFRKIDEVPYMYAKVEYGYGKVIKRVNSRASSTTRKSRQSRLF